ncbi:MAG TPA: formate dehydrogenase subunit delta [Steroidobacteraceae bacterium]|jgi:formate dehydrogenase subunit delta|nr:formate dehydrogenase subunit delta [Steroidobacteraceae bacterium]
MKIDPLIKMANQIGAFFEGEGGGEHLEEAAKLTATHIRRYWEPRMRKEMIEHFQQHAGEGLDEVARNGVALLADGKV